MRAASVRESVDGAFALAKRGRMLVSVRLRTYLESQRVRHRLRTIACMLRSCLMNPRERERER